MRLGIGSERGPWLAPVGAIRAAMLACAVLVSATPVAAQQPPSGRRLQLERQVEERFLNLAAGRLRLDADGRAKLGQVLEQGRQRRQDLEREMMALRGRFITALADSATSQPDIEALLDRLTTLRREEFELWQREQQELGQILTPRQRAEFMMLQMRFNERVRELQARRGPRPGGPGPGPPPPL